MIPRKGVITSHKWWEHHLEEKIKRWLKDLELLPPYKGNQTFQPADTSIQHMREFKGSPNTPMHCSHTHTMGLLKSDTTYLLLFPPEISNREESTKYPMHCSPHTEKPIGIQQSCFSSSNDPLTGHSTKTLPVFPFSSSTC